MISNTSVSARISSGNGAKGAERRSPPHEHPGQAQPINGCHTGKSGQLSALGDLGQLIPHRAEKYHPPIAVPQEGEKPQQFQASTSAAPSTLASTPNLFILIKIRTKLKLPDACDTNGTGAESAAAGMRSEDGHIFPLGLAFQP